jgi:hypothetical protein
MSEVKHRIFIGANTVVDVDGVYIPAPLYPFTADSVIISADSVTRTADETI